MRRAFETHTKICIVCKKEFASTRSHAKTCSSTCRTIYNRHKSAINITPAPTIEDVKMIEQAIAPNVAAAGCDPEEQLRLLEQGKVETQSRLRKRWKQLQELRQKYAWVEFFDEYVRLNKMFGSA